jgi:N-acetylglucosamine-6-phosphate deacetylase
MIVTLAPELPGATALIEILTAEGVTVALGHTAASRVEIHAAVAAGARLSTHLGNGSSAVLPRLDNHIWSQIAEDRLWASVIADGYHVPPDALRAMVRAKTPSRIVLVSDVSPVAGLPPGPTRWGPFDVEVHPDGHVSLMGTPYLAGAGHLLDRCVAQAVKNTDMTLGDAIDACTVRVGELTGAVATDPGRVYPGATAEDLIRFIWNPGDDALRVTDVIRRAKVTAVDAPSGEG